jgi:hypothetical protein
MKQEFKISAGHMISTNVIAAIMPVFVLFFIVSPGAAESREGLTVFLLFSIAIEAAVAAETIKKKVTISDDSIALTKLWGTRELQNANVKGFRIREGVIFIKPVDGYTKITIGNYLLLDNAEELVACLNARYTNLKP